jgi:hypothetical protein
MEGARQLSVRCGEKQGFMDTSTFLIQVNCFDGFNGGFVSPPDFERLAGKAQCKKWKHSIKVCDGGNDEYYISLASWAQNHNIKLPSASKFIGLPADSHNTQVFKPSDQPKSQAGTANDLPMARSWSAPAGLLADDDFFGLADARHPPPTRPRSNKRGAQHQRVPPLKRSSFEVRPSPADMAAIDELMSNVSLPEQDWNFDLPIFDAEDPLVPDLLLDEAIVQEEAENVASAISEADGTTTRVLSDEPSAMDPHATAAEAASRFTHCAPAQQSSYPSPSVMAEEQMQKGPAQGMAPAASRSSPAPQRCGQKQVQVQQQYMQQKVLLRPSRGPCQSQHNHSQQAPGPQQLVSFQHQAPPLALPLQPAQLQHLPSPPNARAPPHQPHQPLPASHPPPHLPSAPSTTSPLPHIQHTQRVQQLLQLLQQAEDDGTQAQDGSCEPIGRALARRYVRLPSGLQCDLELLLQWVKLLGGAQRITRGRGWSLIASQMGMAESCSMQLMHLYISELLHVDCSCGHGVKVPQ